MRPSAVSLIVSTLFASVFFTSSQAAISMAYCQDVDNSFEQSAFNSLPVLQGVFSYFGYRLTNSSPDFNAPRQVTQAIRSSKVEILTAPRHGTVERLSPQSDFWQYTPTKGYTGEDRVTFLVMSQGRKFNITANLLVHEVVDEYANPRTCERHFSHKSGSHGFDAFPASQQKPIIPSADSP